MIFLRTGLPGASKTLNSLREIIHANDGTRPHYYTNIKLLMLDMDVARSFSGWFYGWYFPRLKDAALKKKLIKFMKPVHDEGDFLSLDDVPWLKPMFEAHDHFDTWLYWVNRVYPKKALTKLYQVLELSTESVDKFELVSSLNLHFTHFDDPHSWHELPKKSVILIDECQQFFPPRKVGSAVPKAIGQLETHRHGGYDLHFITQDRTLCDANLRKLVGTHIHFFNAFGGKKVTRKQASKCFDPNDYHDSKSATKKVINRDSKIYGLYWSAEIHTHKFKVPAAAFLALFFVLLMAISLYSFGSKFLFGEPTAPDAEPIPVEQTSPNSAPDTNPKPADTIEPETILASLLTDVYITGSLTLFDGNQRTIDYTFVRTSDDAVFHPDAIGLIVEQVSPCLVNIRLGESSYPITCNPFYIREVVESVDDEMSSDSYLASAEESERFAPNFKLF